MHSYKDIDINKVLTVKNAPRVNMVESKKFYTGELKDFQKKGVAYLYFAKRCGLFDACGSGKTHHIMALISLLKERGELGRCLYVVPAADILSKREEFSRFTRLNFVVAVGTLSDRLSLYNSWFDVLIISYEILRGRDSEYLKMLEYDTVFLDESHIFKNPETKTAQVVKDITLGASRVYTLTATPIQMSLLDLYNQVMVWHNGIFGGLKSFKNRYCVEGDSYQKRGSRLVSVKKIVSYKNIEEFQRIIEPFYMRRTISDIENEMPELVTEKVWGNLSKPQEKIYNELKKGVVELLKYGKKVEAKKHIHNMQKSVNSTRAIGNDGKDYSWKFDWVLHQLYYNEELGFGGSMSKDKVVIFAQHKDTLRVLSERLKAVNIGYVVMTGDESKEVRNSYRKLFWDDPYYRVMLGTTAIECSANLQCARYLIAVDVLSNPARVSQLVGRIRRTGSVYKTTVFIMLLTRNTFEEKVIERLDKRQALHDNVFNENSEIFDELSELEMLQLFQ